MNEELRLTGMRLLYIHSELAIDVKDVIDRFAVKKSVFDVVSSHRWLKTDVTGTIFIYRGHWGDYRPLSTILHTRLLL